MAGVAAARDLRVVHVVNRVPCRSRMAITAETGSGYVICRALGCTDQRCRRVAGGTVRNRRVKYAAGVAALARDVQMRAVKRETGAEMVKVLLASRSSRNDERRDNEQQLRSRAPR